MEQAFFDRYARQLLQRLGKMRYGKTYTHVTHVNGQRWTVDLGVRPDYSRNAYVFAYASSGCGRLSYKTVIPLNTVFTSRKTYVFSPSQ